MNNYFVEHLRDLYRESHTRTVESYIKEVDRQLVTVIDRIPQAKENLRQQARDLVQTVRYCFLVDFKDIHARYPNLQTPKRFYDGLDIICTALKQDFPGMDVVYVKTGSVVVFTVSAEL